jgi:hypothetical protein
VVTSEHFVRRGSAPGQFAIRDLQKVGIAPVARASVRSRVVVPAAAALVAAAVVSANGAVLVALAITAASGAGAMAAVLRRRRLRRWELRATYHGRTQTLYSSTDQRVFNQVSRALRRAIENA